MAMYLFPREDGPVPGSVMLCDTVTWHWTPSSPVLTTCLMLYRLKDGSLDKWVRVRRKEGEETRGTAHTTEGKEKGHCGPAPRQNRQSIVYTVHANTGSIAMTSIKIILMALLWLRLGRYSNLLSINILNVKTERKTANELRLKRFLTEVGA